MLGLSREKKGSQSWPSIIVRSLSRLSSYLAKRKFEFLIQLLSRVLSLVGYADCSLPFFFSYSHNSQSLDTIEDVLRLRTLSGAHRAQVRRSSVFRRSTGHR